MGDVGHELAAHPFQTLDFGEVLGEDQGRDAASALDGRGDHVEQALVAPEVHLPGLLAALREGAVDDTCHLVVPEHLHHPLPVHRRWVELEHGHGGGIGQRQGPLVVDDEESVGHAVENGPEGVPFLVARADLSLQARRHVVDGAVEGGRLGHGGGLRSVGKPGRGLCSGRLRPDGPGRAAAGSLSRGRAATR